MPTSREHSAAVAQAFADHPKADAVCGGAILVNEGRVVRHLQPRDLTRPSASPTAHISSGPAFQTPASFRRDTLKRVGDFRIDYRFIADRDWLARFYKNKLTTVALPDPGLSLSAAPGSLTFGENPVRQLRRSGKNCCGMAREWRDDTDAPEDMRQFAAAAWKAAAHRG